MAKINFNLENSIKDLEKVITDLESGELTLEESLKSFESGVKLYKGCKNHMGSIEKKIMKLTDELKEVDFEESAE